MQRISLRSAGGLHKSKCIELLALAADYREVSTAGLWSYCGNDYAGRKGLLCECRRG